MRRDTSEDENTTPPERASVRAMRGPRKRALEIANAVGIDLTPEEADEIRHDAERGHRQPKSRPAFRREASMGPAGRARRRMRGEKPAKGKQGTQAKSKAQRAAASRKLHGHKKLKSTRGSPKAIRRIRNRRRSR